MRLSPRGRMVTIEAERLEAPANTRRPRGEAFVVDVATGAFEMLTAPGPKQRVGVGVFWDDRTLIWHRPFEFTGSPPYPQRFDVVRLSQKQAEHSQLTFEPSRPPARRVSRLAYPGLLVAPSAGTVATNDVEATNRVVSRQPFRKSSDTIMLLRVEGDPASDGRVIEAVVERRSHLFRIFSRWLVLDSLSPDGRWLLIRSFENGKPASTQCIDVRASLRPVE